MLPPLLRPTAADCCVCALPPAPEYAEADADALEVELEYEDEDFLLEESAGSESSRSSGDCAAPPVLLLELLELRAGDEVAAAASLRKRPPERELRSRRKFASESAPFRSLQGNISRQKAVIIIISLSAKYTYSNGSNGI